MPVQKRRLQRWRGVSPFFVIVFAVVLSSVYGKGLAADVPREQQAREHFLKIERIARLPEVGQKHKLPILYRDLAPRVMNPIVEALLSSYPRNILDHKKGFGNPGQNHTEAWADQLGGASKKLSPEAVADRLKIPLWWNIAARVRAMQVLRRFPKDTARLIARDFETGTRESVGRAAMTIVSLKLKEFSPQLLDCFRADNETSEPARSALIFLHDPGIVEPLLKQVEQEPKFLIRCAGLFQGPLARKPALPELLRLLNSEDNDIRYHAAWALCECRDARLAEPAVRMVNHKQQRFRTMAGMLASKLPPVAYGSVREKLMPLLADKDQEVRFQALRGFAAQKDAAIGPVLIELLSKDSLPEGRKVLVMQAMSSLTGSTFRYDLHKWGPGTAQNRRAIEDLRVWLKRFGRRSGRATNQLSVPLQRFASSTARRISRENWSFSGGSSTRE